MQKNNHNYIKKILHSGAGMLEVLMAIGLLASLAPFVFKTINKQTATMRNLAVVKEIENVMYAFGNYMDSNMPLPGDPKNPPEGSPERTDFTGKVKISDLLKDYGLGENISAIWNLFSNQQLVMYKKNDSMEGYIILSLYEDENPSIDTLGLQEIAGLLGPNAATVEYNEIQGTTAPWGFTTETITADQIQSGVLIQMSRGAGKSDIYLNRVQPEKAAMYTDLLMNRKEMKNTGAVFAEALNGGEDVLTPFQVTKMTKILQLAIDNFDVKAPARLTGDEKLTLTSYLMEVSNASLNIQSVDASKSLLKPSEDSIMGDVKVRRLDSPLKIKTNKFNLTGTSVLKNNVEVISKEIIAGEMKWGAQINADNIVSQGITLMVDSATGGLDVDLVTNDGFMNMSDFLLVGYEGSFVGEKKVSNITNEATKEIQSLQCLWVCIKANKGINKGCTGC